MVLHALLNNIFINDEGSKGKQRRIPFFCAPFASPGIFEGQTLNESEMSLLSPVSCVLHDGASNVKKKKAETKKK